MRVLICLLSLILYPAGFLSPVSLAAQPAAGGLNQIAQTTPVPAPMAPALNPPIAADSAPPAANIGAGLHELSPWSMFLNADIIVKGVMIGLAFASAVTWTVFLAKTVELSSAAGRLKGSLRRIANTRSLMEAQAASSTIGGVISNLVDAALLELSLSEDCLLEEGVKERAASSFSEVVKAEARGIKRGTGLLATIGATAPFVGLFGTVWGIMNSFIGISKAQTTNLAVVAPGIAEALLATAIGLVAAIPAVVIYNHFWTAAPRICHCKLEIEMGAALAESDDDDLPEAHDINVTPFIDVILVLLIIFMVAAPLSTVDLPIDLPQSTAMPQKKPDKPTYLTIKGDLSLALGETPVKRRDLIQTLESSSDPDKERRLFLRADRSVPYGEMMDVLELLRSGGFLKVSLVALEGVAGAQPSPGAKP